MGLGSTQVHPLSSSRCTGLIPNTGAAPPRGCSLRQHKRGHVTPPAPSLQKSQPLQTAAQQLRHHQAALNPGNWGEMPGPYRAGAASYRQPHSGSWQTAGGLRARSYAVHAKSTLLSRKHRALPGASAPRLHRSKSSISRGSKCCSTSELEMDEVTSSLKSLPFSSCSQGCATD